MALRIEILARERAIPACRAVVWCGFGWVRVSQYLTVLRNAGLVSAHRAGRSVLYARTTAAETLLKAASS